MAAWSAVVALAGSGCVTTNRPDPEACEADSITIELTLTDAGLAPNDPAACGGQRVILDVTSARDAVLHVHGFDEIPLTELRDGERTRIPFEATRTGQFPIELHSTETPAGESVGILTVHEP